MDEKNKRKKNGCGSLSKLRCRVLIWGVLHCRCERTRIQQTQYNEFGREAGSRTGPLRGLHHRSGRIVREQDHQRGWGGAKVCPQASSEDEPSRLELSSVFRTVIPPLCEVSLVIYPSAPFILAVHLLIMQVVTWVSVPSSASFNLLWVAVDRVTLFRGHSFINVARLPVAGI